MIQLSRISREITRRSTPIYTAGSYDPVAYANDRSTITYNVEFFSATTQLKAGDPVTLVQDNTLIKGINKDLGPTGFVQSMSLYATGTGSAVIMFQDDPSFDFEAERILRKAW